MDSVCCLLSTDAPCRLLPCCVCSCDLLVRQVWIGRPTNSPLLSFVHSVYTYQPLGTGCSVFSRISLGLYSRGGGSLCLSRAFPLMCSTVCVCAFSELCLRMNASSCASPFAFKDTDTSHLNRLQGNHKADRVFTSKRTVASSGCSSVLLGFVPRLSEG